MQHDVREFADAGSLARSAAGFIAELASDVVKVTGTFAFAVSGGHTPEAMFKELATSDMPWEHTVIYQVDERVAPLDDPSRNLTELTESLASVPARIEQMPVDDSDLAAAAERYAALLPAHLDLVHLGLGTDGHTASLVPGDPALDVVDRLVTITGMYQGKRRMTLTYPALSRSGQIMWLVSGADKRDALAKLLRNDQSIPASRVQAPRSLVFTDQAVA